MMNSWSSRTFCSVKVLFWQGTYADNQNIFNRSSVNQRYSTQSSPQTMDNPSSTIIHEDWKSLYFNLLELFNLCLCSRTQGSTLTFQLISLVASVNLDAASQCFFLLAKRWQSEMSYLRKTTTCSVNVILSTSQSD